MKIRFYPKKISSISFIFIITILIGCHTNHIPFTSRIETAYNLKPKQISNLQFYTSGKIILERELKSGEQKITPGHFLIKKRGKYIERIIIKKHTPCIVSKIKHRGIFYVKFERGNNNLKFSRKGSSDSDMDDALTDSVISEQYYTRSSRISRIML